MRPKKLLFKTIQIYVHVHLSTNLFMQIKPTTNMANAIITATDVMIMIENSVMEKILAMITFDQMI